jgi:hypothetical protein
MGNVVFGPKKIGSNQVGPIIKWAEWLIGPKNANWPKNILPKFDRF